MTRGLLAAMLGLACVLGAGPALAAAPPAPVASPPAPIRLPTEDVGGADRGVSSLPEIGDLLEAVDKVTGDDAEARDWSAPVKLAVVFTGLALLPAALVMMTSFTRVVIVLSFIRRALTTQNIPPNIAIIGLALFLTLFTMAPTLKRMNGEAVQPYLADELSFQAATDKGFGIIKQFMIRQTRQGDLALFLDLGEVAAERPEEVPIHVAIPAFAVSEFRMAFQMGCLLFIPFLLIDLVVAGILLSAGMMMLPPVIISLPLKIILFVLVDGWRLLAESLVSSFY